jgi:glycosyltransferase involved in cell wall biosynthesis
MPDRPADGTGLRGQRPRVALIHDWLTGMRGGERVLEALCALFPDAALFTLIHVRGTTSPAIDRLRPRSSFVRSLPFARRYYRQYLPLFPTAIEQFDLDGYDLIVSSSHCAAKAVVRPGRARHLCYCHSPMRYAWDQFDAYFGPDRIGPVASRLMRPAMAAMARWDAGTAGRVDRFLSNSQYVAGRIRRYYNREATVVYPPVDTEFFRPDGSRADSFLLIVSALVPYKRLELAIHACRAVGASLKIVGDGPERAHLQRLAGPGVEFLGRVDVCELRALYQRAAALVLPGEEDFGMAPVEAQACGRPVVALARGGAVESIDDGETGVLVTEPTVEAFADGLARLWRQRFDGVVIRERALRFSPGRFAAGVTQAVDELMSSDRVW